METRRLIIAILLAFGVYLAYMTLYSRFGPKPPPPPPSTLPEALQTPPSQADGTSQPSSAPAAAVAATQFSFSAGLSEDPITLGGGEGDTLRVELTPRGASVAHLWLTEQKKGRYVHRTGPRSNDPYELLHPVDIGDGQRFSFTTARIWIEQRGNESWRLDDLIWQHEPSTASAPAGQSARFVTTLREPEGAAALLRLVKSYSLTPGPMRMTVELAIENLSGEPLTVVVAQDGPSGIRRESMQGEMRRLLGASRKDGAIVFDNVQRAAIKTAQDTQTPHKLSQADPNVTFVWTALLNKFFGVFTRPIARDGATPTFLQSVTALVDAPGDGTGPEHGGDLRARFFTNKLGVAVGGTSTIAFEVYAGPRDPDVLKTVNPDFADKTKLGYIKAVDADHTCCACTFEPLPSMMSGLLRGIYFVVRNYGVAIIILVIIIRTVLHPLSRFQQKSMYRMQESMGRIQPKMALLKERYANDKMKLNQEMMKLWAEENVNPAAGLFAFIPIFLQMPILVALWTAMNTEIQLRNAPFDGWWIVDLSAPDALISFGAGGLTIPVLSWIPFIGPWMFSNIPSFNVLPILMGVSMWLQQKYMPKPAMQARLEAAKNQPTPAGGQSIEDQMRQQQMMANMMSIMFPLMFYYMPAGLNLYWMATNVYGICESLIIRKQLEREKELRAKQGPPPPARPGPMARVFKWMAEQGSELQQKADNVTEQDRKKSIQKERDDRRKRN